MDGKVAGVVTWKASEGENLNFAVPSKLIFPLLSDSNVHPLGTTSAAQPVVPSAPLGERIWTSMTTGRDYKVRADGDYIYAEWVLPAPLQATAAFMRLELKKNGEKWIGKARSYLPYEYKSSYFDFWRTGQTIGTANVNGCRVEVDVEIDKLSDARVEGKSQGYESFDAKKCHPGKLEWKPFAWIPK
jgi:hypothetical protein